MSRVLARKHALTAEETRDLVSYTKRDEILLKVEAFSREYGCAFGSPLVRGYLLDLMKGRTA